MNLDEVASVALELPGTHETQSRGSRVWKATEAASSKFFVWERPFSKADLKRFGDEPIPIGPIIGIRTEDLHEKEALLQSQLVGVFTIPHFDGYAAVLVDLSVAEDSDVRELITGGWLSCLPPKAAADWVASHGGTVASPDEG